MKKSLLLISAVVALVLFTISVGAAGALDWGASDFTDISEDFTIAVITDTSKIAGNAELLNDMTEWIAANKTSENIKCAVHMGNIINMSMARSYWTDLDTYGYNYGYLHDGFIKDPVASAQATNFVNALKKLSAAGVPYLVATGTSDFMGAYDRTSYISHYLTPSEFGVTGYSTRTYRKNLTNPITEESVPAINSLVGAYYTFTAAGQDFLVITLEAWPTAYARDWFDSVLDANTDKKVIVITSSFLKKDGTMKPCWPLPLPTSFPVEYNGVTCATIAEYRRQFGNVMSSYNISNMDTPIDGVTIWNSIYANYDNIILALDGGVQKMGGADTTSASANRLVTKMLIYDDFSLLPVVQANYDDQLGDESGAILLIKFYDNATKADFAVYSATYDAYVMGKSHTYSLDFSDLRYPISGNVLLTGTPTYGNTVTASVVNLEPSAAPYTIQWLCDGNVIATGASYEIDEKYIGKSIAVKAIGIGVYGGETAASYIVPRKANTAAPESPAVLEEKTKGSITVATQEGYEYRLNDGEWQTSGYFDGLRAGTTYTIWSRIAETSTAFASPKGPALTVTTVSTETTGSSVILGDVNGNGKVTVADLILLRRHVSWGATINEKASDIDGNGRITTIDFVRLTQYFSGWEVKYDIGSPVSSAPSDTEYGDQDVEWPWNNEEE